MKCACPHNRRAILIWMSEPAHLRVYRFGEDATFEGGLVAAIERVELTSDAKLLDALFLMRDPASGEIHAVDRGVGGGDSTFASLLDFRLDPSRRQTITERTLAEHPGGVPRPLIEAIGGALEAGGAIFAVLHAGPAATVLDEAVERASGRLIVDEPVDADTLADVGPELSAAAASTTPRN
jgi:hypothetical protein